MVVPSGAFPSSSSHPQQQQGPSGAAGGQGGAAAAAGPQDKRERWEEGHPDYMGSASFDNILKKIETTMSSPGNVQNYTLLKITHFNIFTSLKMGETFYGIR